MFELGFWQITMPLPSANAFSEAGIDVVIPLEGGHQSDPPVEFRPQLKIGGQLSDTCPLVDGSLVRFSFEFRRPCWSKVSRAEWFLLNGE